MINDYITINEKTIIEILNIAEVIKDNFDTDLNVISEFIDDNWIEWIEYKQGCIESFWLNKIEEKRNEILNCKKYLDLLYGSESDKILFELITKSDYDRILLLHQIYPGEIEAYVSYHFVTEWEIFMSESNKYRHKIKSFNETEKTIMHDETERPF